LFLKARARLPFAFSRRVEPALKRRPAALLLAPAHADDYAGRRQNK
jgi:hypothetical protein